MMCEAVKVFHLDMHHDSAEVLERIVSPFHFKLKKSGVIHGFGTWFDSGFRSSRSEEDSIVLTTSPFGESTHWRNVTFVLEEQVSLQSGDEISGEFIISRNPQWLRHFDVKISFEVLGSGLKVSQSMPVWR